MSRGNHKQSFESRVKVDNLALNQRLRSWYPTAARELSEVEVTLRLAKDDIADCDTEMHRLKSRREGLILYAEKLSGLLSPIRRLPNEILCQIFLDCCAENDLRNGKTGTADILSSVCTRFRELAISYSALWSNLTIFLPADYDFDKRGDLIRVPKLLEEETKLSSLIQLYLDRSKNHPLSLDLDIETREVSTEHCSLRLLARESNRWKHLIFRGGAFDPEYGFPSLDHLSFPLLESIAFDAGLNQDYIFSPEAEAFLLAPRIRKLRFHDMLVDVLTISAFSSTWKSLKHLDYHTTMVFKYLWTILDLCPALGSLKLEGLNNGEDEDGTQSNTPRNLPTLSSLTVINNGFHELDDTLECIISSLTTPNLSKLVLEQDNDKAAEHPRKSFPIINQFFERSRFRSLASLVIQCLYIRDQDMVTLLRQLPSLQELSIHDPPFPGLASHNPISKSFIESLHAWKRSPLRRSVEPLVSQLRELTLKVETEGFDPFSFVDTIASRWLPDEFSVAALGLVCLRSIELHLGQIVDAKPYEPLKQFEKAGLRVVVRCKGMKDCII
ncbi:hypothetical protein BDP27DRAFT_1335053 [Rhodocollybia butyracea]|uniref:F-box domain-containing protein n=1 Tax=Rhodocollybia butyracea TaxID=206335 RepID=A0A9P5PHW1_9AGAR|nr:hypothetical protein BDP27DRAFT_1335053 [Rhodocollybia butyracea]